MYDISLPQSALRASSPLVRGGRFMRIIGTLSVMYMPLMVRGIFMGFIRKRWDYRPRWRCRFCPHPNTEESRPPGCTGRVLRRIHGAT